MKFTKTNKAFTLVEIIIVLVILAVLAAVTIPALLGYVAHSKQVACQTNRAFLTRIFNAYKLQNPECSLEKVFDGDCPALSADFQQAACPSGGIYYVEAGVIKCTEHDNAGGGTTDPEPELVEGTTIPVTENTWPTVSDYEEAGVRGITVTAGGVFRYTDGNLYVITKDTLIDKDQAPLGPALITGWDCAVKLTGNIVTFTGSEMRTVVRGDLCKVGDTYYVFNSTGGSWVTTPPGSLWYQVP